MVRVLFKISSLAALFMVTATSYAAVFEAPAIVAAVKDVYKRAGDNLQELQRTVNEAKAHNENLRNITGLQTSLNDVIGVPNLNFVQDELANIQSFYYKLGSPKGILDTIKATGSRIQHNQSAPPTEQFNSLKTDVGNNLYIRDFKNTSESSKDLMLGRRELVAEEASVTGIAMATHKKQSLAITQEEIKSTLDKAMHSTTLRQDQANTNKLLGIIAQELTQIRELQAQQLEVVAAFLTGMQPLHQPRKEIARGAK